MFATRNEVEHAMCLSSAELQESLLQGNAALNIINSEFVGFTGTCFVYEIVHKTYNGNNKCNVYVLLRKDVFSKKHIFHSYI